jgi:hypothetical protein
MRLSNKKLESELLWGGSFSPGIAGTAESSPGRQSWTAVLGKMSQSDKSRRDG